MHNYNMEMLPPSYSYNEIIKKIDIGNNEVAYCYAGGKNKDAIIFKSKEGKLLMFFAEKTDGQILDNFELWSLLSDIPNGTIRQNAVNRWFEVFNTFDGHLNLVTYDFNI